MKAEFITPVALDTKQGETCAARIAERETGENVSSVRYLGGGSFGKAYRVTHRNGNRIVVKFLRAPDMLKKEYSTYLFLPNTARPKYPLFCFRTRRTTGFRSIATEWKRSKGKPC